jgi:hypothetical protein
MHYIAWLLRKALFKRQKIVLTPFDCWHTIGSHVFISDASGVANSDPASSFSTNPDAYESWRVHRFLFQDLKWRPLWVELYIV